jgi:hypothetical protein
MALAARTHYVVLVEPQIRMIRSILEVMCRVRSDLATWQFQTTQILITIKDHDPERTPLCRVPQCVLEIST